MSRDPWEGTGWRPQTLNHYTYSRNNPANWVDPSGQRAVDQSGGHGDPVTNPFEDEMPSISGDDYVQAAWNRMMWSLWMGNKELAEAYRNEVAPYLMSGWRPEGSWKE